MRAASLNVIGFDYAHLPEMTDLWVSSWQRAYPKIEFEARRGWAVDRFVSLHKTGVTFLLALDPRNGTMTGFMTLDRPTGHIDQVVVAPRYWGKGVADELLNRAKPSAPGRMMLDVNADNSSAIALYVRHGFNKTGEGVNPISGRAIVHMEWRVAD